MSMRCSFVLFVCAISIASTLQAAQLTATYASLPPAFECNEGQAGARTDYISRGRGYALSLSATELFLALHGTGTTPASVAMRLLRARAGAGATPIERLRGVTNYFIGSDPRRWRIAIPNYARVRYEDVYPGIDVDYYGSNGELEYDFMIAPGAEPSAIELAFDGAERVAVQSSGDLLLAIGGHDLHLRKPVAWQEAAGKRRPVGVRYRVIDDHVRFEVDRFDRTLPLIIDPVLVYSTYFDSGRMDRPYAIAVDSSGNVVIAGEAGTLGPSGYTADAFVAKIAADGSHLIYNTFLGAGGFDAAYGVAVDAGGNAYVAGFTESAGFPTTSGAYDTSYNGGNEDVFVTKLSSAGALVYSTFLGGTDNETAAGVGVDALGNAWVSGGTTSADFPTTAGAAQPGLHGFNDVFATRLNATGSALLYSTYLGGSGAEGSSRIAADAAGNAWVTGWTHSADFPVTPGAYQTSWHGSEDGFLVKLSADGSGPAFSTLLGGAGSDLAYDVAIDAAGNAYIMGTTISTDFPTTAGAFDTTPNGPPSTDLFITKVNPDGSGIVFSTILGGSDGDSSAGIAVDAPGNVWVAAKTYSGDFPVTAPIPHSALPDAVVARLNPTGSSLSESRFLGGSASDDPTAIAIDGAGAIFVTGYTSSSDFPTTAGVMGPFNHGNDGFVAKITTTPESDTTPPSLVQLDFTPWNVDTTFAAQSVAVRMQLSDDLSGVNSGCAMFTAPSGATRLTCASLSSGTTVNGIWDATLVLPQFAEAGTWRLSAVLLGDVTGNSVTISEMTLAARGFHLTLEVTSIPDVTGPVVTSITFSPTLVDVSAGPATITVDVAVSDDISRILLGPPCTFMYASLRMAGPVTHQPRDVGCWGFTRIAGTDRGGVWRGTFTMPQFSEAGDWEVGSLRILDSARNATVLNNAGAVALGTVPLRVISVPADVTPAQLVGLEFTPHLIDTSNHHQIVTVRLTIHDDLSGLDVTPILSFQSSSVLFRSPSGGQTVHGIIHNLVAGTALDGVWEAEVTFPALAESGTWMMQFVDFKDGVSNHTTLNTAALQALGVPTDVIVIRPSLEVDGSLSPAGGTVTDTAFGSRASIAAPPGVLTAVTTVAIDVLPEPLAVPMPAGFSAPISYYVNVTLTPTPAFPLPAPGMTVTLPMHTPLLPGAALGALFFVDAATGGLVEAVDSAGRPLIGVVGADGLSVTFTGITHFSTIVALMPERKTVSIDIEPHSPSAVPAISLKNNRPIEVAILSTPTFDAVAVIDQTSLTFGRTGNEASLTRCNPGKIDINHDNLRDLVCTFTTSQTGFRAGDVIGVLQGQTTGGVAIGGTDSIRVTN